MSVLRHRNFAVLFAGQLVSQAGDNLFVIALPWYVYTRTGSKAALALAGLAATLPRLAGLVTGVWVDRWPKRRTMIAADVLRGLLCVVLFGATAGAAPVAGILALVLGLQLVGAFATPAFGAFLPRVVPAGELPAATGLFQSGTALAQLGGMLAGGVLVDVLGAPLLFLLDGISFLVFAGSLLFLRVDEAGGTARGAGGLLAEWLEGFGVVARSRMVRRFLLAAMVSNFALAPTDLLLTAWVRGPLHGSASLLGVMSGGFFAGMMAGGVLLGRLARRRSTRSLVAAGLLAVGVFSAALGAWADAVWGTGATVGVGVGAGLASGALSAWFLRAVPQAMLGRMTGIVNGLSTAMVPLGVAVFGALMVRLPLPLLWLVLGAIPAAAGLGLVAPVEDDLERVVNSQAPGVRLAALGRSRRNGTSSWRPAPDGAGPGLPAADAAGPVPTRAVRSGAADLRARHGFLWLRPPC
ncbi:MAG: MFS transporter [Bacillota bacterium]|nr:MFS transporter [Bacillota bacterium]